MLWLFLKFLNPERLRLLHLHFFHEFHDRGIWCNGKRRFLFIASSDFRASRLTTGPRARQRGRWGRVLEVDLGHGLWKLHGRVKEASQRLKLEGKSGHGFFGSVNLSHGILVLIILGSNKKRWRFSTKSIKKGELKVSSFPKNKELRKGRGILA